MISQMVNKELKDLLNKLSPSGSVVYLDLETTGVDNSKDKIIEIGEIEEITERILQIIY